MRTSVIIAAVIGVFALAGCTAPATPFDGEAASDDVLPEVIENYALNDLDESTIRYQGSTESAEVWAARPATGDGACLIAVPSDQPDSWLVACGGSSFVGAEGANAGEFEFYPQGLPADEPREGWSALNEFIISRD